MAGRYIPVENVSVFPRSWAKTAAGMVVLLGLPVTPANDIQRGWHGQAKVFSEPETFIQPQRGNMVVILGTSSSYNPALDVRRQTQAKIFSDPESYVKAQTSNPVVLATYAIAPQQFTAVRAAVLENLSGWAHAQRGTLTVISAPPPPPQSSDVFIGNDTTGWPELLPDPWAPPNRGTLVVLNSFAAYNVATDVRRATQAKWFGEPESFIQPQHINYVVNDTLPYNPATDVTRLRQQAKVFSEPEFFPRPQQPFAETINFTPYVPGHDVRRATQAKVFSEPEFFPARLPFNEIVTNGTAAPPVKPHALGHWLDVYDDLNGSLSLAWSELLSPAAQSYNVYVNGVLYATVSAPGPGGNWTTVIKGLKTTTYNPSGSST